MAQTGRARSRAGTWPLPAGGIPAPWVTPLPAIVGLLAGRLRRWAAAETAPGRLIPWVPVAFGIGVIVYFAADREPLAARIALWGVREITVLTVASLAAGLATTPYAAYHFHRMAPYGVIANVLAMPVISAVSMPAGLLAVAAMPFGFDAPLWRLMGLGINWMVTVALWVAGLPGAVGHVAAFSGGALLLATAGLLAMGLLRSPLRFIGTVLALAGGAAATMAARPDVMTSAGGDVVAVRGADGRLAAVKFGNDTLSVREWLAADGDARDPANATVKAGFACDPDGCVARLPDGAIVAVSRTAAAFADDCTRAVLIITQRAVPADCAARIIDRAMLRKNGALALTWRDGRFETAAARPDGIERPWTRRRESGADGKGGQGIGGRSVAAPAMSRMPATRDATPLQPDADAQQ